MQTLRSVFSLFLGYLILELAAVAASQVPGFVMGSQQMPLVFAAATFVQMIGAFSGGYTAAHVAGRNPTVHGIVLAALIILIAADLLYNSSGHLQLGPHAAAVALMAVCAALGGWARSKRA